MSFSDADDAEFVNVDEALPSEDQVPDLRAVVSSPVHSASSHFAAVSRPNEPPDIEDFSLSDSESGLGSPVLEDFPNITSQFGAPYEDREVVDRLYMKQQLRDNEVAYKRKQQEYLELKDCTFQPNIHLRSPEGSPTAFLANQKKFEIRRKARLEKMQKERETRVLEHEKRMMRTAPELSPGTRNLVAVLKTKDSRGLVDRLLTPKRTKELVPELSYAYHPLISPKAQHLKRDENVHESLYKDAEKQQKAKKIIPKKVAVDFTNARSEALVRKQLNRELRQACQELSLGERVDFPQFQLVLCRLKFATEADTGLMEECWKSLTGKMEGETDIGRVRILLEDAMGYKHKMNPPPQDAPSQTEDSKSSHNLQQQFLRMHKSRLNSPSKYHQHPDPFSYKPELDPQSLTLVKSEGRDRDYFATLKQYQESLEKKMRKEVEKKKVNEMIGCTFLPKVNRVKTANPLIEKIHSMSPSREIQFSEENPRYELLYQYGTLLKEERRILPSPDHSFEENKSELTFHPKRFTSVSPKRTEAYPIGFDQTVSRLKTGFSQHEELVQKFARGEVVTGSWKVKPRREKTMKPVLEARKNPGEEKREEEETNASNQG